MNIRKFKQTKFDDRTQAIKVPELAQFFAEGEEVEIVVKGLTAEELMIVNESASRAEKMAAVIESLAGDNKDAANVINEALGVTGKSVPQEHSRRLAMMELGSVSPKFDRQAVLHLSVNYPTIFIDATTKIAGLTGLGRVAGKQKGSGKATESEPL